MLVEHNFIIFIIIIILIIVILNPKLKLWAPAEDISASFPEHASVMQNDCVVQFCVLWERVWWWFFLWSN